MYLYSPINPTFPYIHVKLGFPGCSLHGLVNVMMAAYKEDELGDNCIDFFHLGRYIIGFTVENFVLSDAIAVKCNFRQ